MNKIEQIIPILDQHKVLYATKVISGGYQIKTANREIINCYNTGAVTLQGQELPLPLRMQVLEVLQKPAVKRVVEFELNKQAEVLSHTEILSMYQALRSSLEAALEKQPVLLKQLKEIPEVYF